jgi:hypothetical protein
MTFPSSKISAENRRRTRKNASRIPSDRPRDPEQHKRTRRHNANGSDGNSRATRIALMIGNGLRWCAEGRRKALCLVADFAYGDDKQLTLLRWRAGILAVPESVVE